MDHVTVAIVIGLILFGAGLAIWPMSLLVGIAEDETRKVQAELDALRKAGEAVVKGEREIAAARSLPAPERVGLLLDGDRPAPRRVS